MRMTQQELSIAIEKLAREYLNQSYDKSLDLEHQSFALGKAVAYNTIVCLLDENILEVKKHKIKVSGN